MVTNLGVKLDCDFKQDKQDKDIYLYLMRVFTS